MDIYIDLKRNTRNVLNALASEIGIHEYYKLTKNLLIQQLDLCKIINNNKIFFYLNRDKI